MGVRIGDSARRQAWQKAGDFIFHPRRLAIKRGGRREWVVALRRCGCRLWVVLFQELDELAGNRLQLRSLSGVFELLAVKRLMSFDNRNAVWQDQSANVAQDGSQVDQCAHTPQRAGRGAD